MHSKISHILGLSKLVLLLCLLVSCQASSNLLSPEKQDFVFLPKTIMSGQRVLVSPLIEGPMNLYFRMIPIYEANLYNPYFPYNEPGEVPQFFIGSTDLLRIDEWNYEYVIKQVMADRPTLTNQLGKQGFRFENIKQMVYYYNEHAQ